jgi:hypothetical protein
MIKVLILLSAAEEELGGVGSHWTELELGFLGQIEVEGTLILIEDRGEKVGCRRLLGCPLRQLTLFGDQSEFPALLDEGAPLKQVLEGLSWVLIVPRKPTVLWFLVYRGDVLQVFICLDVKVSAFSD